MQIVRKGIVLRLLFHYMYALVTKYFFILW